MDVEKDGKGRLRKESARDSALFPPIIVTGFILADMEQSFRHNDERHDTRSNVGLMN